MDKWYEEEWSFTVEVIAVSHDNKTHGHCRNGDEVGDVYRCAYDCPVNQNGRGFCQKSMLILFPMLETVRGGGDLRLIGGFSPVGNTPDSPLCKEFVPTDRQKAERRKLSHRRILQGVNCQNNYQSNVCTEKHLCQKRCKVYKAKYARKEQRNAHAGNFPRGVG